MRFTLIDRILKLDPGKHITAIKTLSLAEEYLQDHFPRFPVMPGVLMTEALFQAASWLVRSSEDFQHSMIILKEARNVKYAGFVAPGGVLTIGAEITKQDATTTTIKAQGVLEQSVAVSGRLVLERYNLAERGTGHANQDDFLRSQLRQQFDILYRPNSG